ncbi:MAG TPA: hypothetical protein VGL37_00740 [Solirubrobacteraceae bacterium]|jgi:hypothetical protein
MSLPSYPGGDARRFAEIAELFASCRATFHDVLRDTQWQPAVGSSALQDIEALSRHDPAYPAGAETKIPRLLFFYMLAASEQLGGVAALYRAHEVLLPPGPLVRNALEFCARANWVLRAPCLEDRLARTYLEELLSSREAAKTASQLLGKNDERYAKRANAHKDLMQEIDRVFPGELKTGKRGTTLKGNRMPGPGECVTLMYKSVSRPVGASAKGIYTFYSNLAHPTLYQLAELWAVSQEDGHVALAPSYGAEGHEKQVRLTVVAFYEMLSYVMSYHGLPHSRHDQLSDELERLLPGFLKGRQRL